MNHDQAWQSVLGQLQMEMPRASFDTWVRDTRPLSFEDGLLTIGVRNAYARDWLESRVSSTVSRLLIGILDAKVNVNFVVAQDEANLDDSPTESPNGEDGFTAEIVTSTRYTDEVNPDRIVLIPGYALRLLKHGDLTPKEMSLWVGFRQAVYGQWRQGKGTVRNIPHWEVIRFAMMSRASYFRELSGKDRLAGGLVEVVPEPAPFGGQSRRWENANRYRVHMSPRLTRHDCAVIESILTTAASMAVSHEEAQSQVQSSLETLAARDPVEYLEQDVEVGKVWPRSILDIVRRVLGLEGDVPDDLAAAAERLYDRIMRGYGKVLITHYFLREVVPILDLNQAQAWGIIMLRDHCWYDYETGTQKDFAMVAGGLDTLAGWIGVSRKTVDRWMGQGEYSAFVLKADLDNIEGLPADWRRTGTEVFLVTQDEPLLGEALDGLDLPEGGTKRDSLVDKVRLVSGQSETRYRTKRDSILDKMRLALGQSETRLNNLIKPLLTPKPTKTLTNRLSKSNAQNGQGAVGRDAKNPPEKEWNFEKLFQTLDINATTQARIRDARFPAWALVAWLLRALTLKGVHEPVGFAISRAASSRTRYQAGADFELLARAPEALLREIKRSLHPYRYGVTLDNQREAYQRVFSSNQALASVLWHLLTGEDECDGVSVMSSVVFEAE